MTDRPRIEQDRGDESQPTGLSAVESQKVDRLNRVPCVIKAILIKFWFAGAAFFFLGFGLFSMAADELDLALALGLTIGLMTDLIINRILDSLDDGRRTMRRYMFFFHERFLFLIANLLYGVLLSFCVFFVYIGINTAAINLFSLDASAVFLPAEPIMYGIFFVIVDFSFLGLKALALYLIFRLRGEN